VILLQCSQFDPKFQVEGVIIIIIIIHEFHRDASLELPSTIHSSFQKTKLNDPSYGRKIGTDFSSVLSQSTHMTEGQTGGQTDGQTDRHLSRR